MDKQELAKKVVQKMLEEDAFSRWLGIEVLEVKPGFAKIQMTVRPEMNNGFSITHGGITYSLADSAFAFASNSHGRVAVAMETNISYLKKVTTGNVLTATAEELSLGNTVGVYNVDILNQNDEKVARFRGTVFRTKESHF
ncbi:hydroxyphenylacetyl-CoA thioesterase PaaI [Balneolaceae bacterium YR4-1]|uniref:Hydroxyphenylacetyl-CoA thioesterase PaaI n=1 Tax=Halalkalibaculum roseum TaxID=2709311 RepID=A0A6M1SSJ3_9BACT|nr:hydroxyphenylacetyl-CoA thioesterase PaaI [Halalkalibaculum roseum]NGP75830.1 hydroxyphenylacetyl-CoA thioesterase PaaI [Halalkalibaculum roseum]